MEPLFPTRWSRDRPPSLEKFTSDFPDDFACAEYLREARWRDGFKCPRCGSNGGWQLEARPWVWQCQGLVVEKDGTRRRTGCRHQTSLIAGTIMHGTHLPLRKWFLAAYFLATHSNGMSALQLQPKLGVGYKTAWLLLHKLRRAMVNPDRDPLAGVIEVDETSVPFRRNTDPADGGQGRSHVGKIFLVGAVEVVDGKYPKRMRLQRIHDTKKKTLQAFVHHNTAAGSHIVTDGYTAYQNPPDRGHTAHNLSADDAPPAHVVLPWVHRIFSNFKRWTTGTYHGVREKHVDIYCNEFVFRWNRRRSFASNIDTMLGLGAKVGPITWRGIVGDTRKWKDQHRERILNRVRSDRLALAEKYAFDTGCDIFDAIDDVRRAEHKHVYARKKPVRPALPPSRPGQKRNTRRYWHPPRLPDDFPSEFLLIPKSSKLASSKPRKAVDLVPLIAA